MKITQLYTSVQSLRLFATPWIAARQASLSITNSRGSLRPHVHRVSDPIQPSHPLLSPSPPASNPFQNQGLFQWVNSSHEVAKVLEFHLPHQSFYQYSGLISFRIDWLHLLAVQETPKSLFQHHSSKAYNSTLTVYDSSLALSFLYSFLYSLTLISIHDCWKNNSFD